MDSANLACIHLELDKPIQEPVRIRIRSYQHKTYKCPKCQKTTKGGEKSRITIHMHKCPGVEKGSNGELLESPVPINLSDHDKLVKEGQILRRGPPKRVPSVNSEVTTQVEQEQTYSSPGTAVAEENLPSQLYTF